MDGLPTVDYRALLDQILRQPLTRMLLLSLSLHAAVIMLVQPRRWPASPEPTVINVRLEAGKPAAPVATVRQEVEPVQLPKPETPPLQQPQPLPPVKQDKAPPAPVVQPSPEPETVKASKPVPEQPQPPTQIQTEASQSPALPSIPVMVDTTWYESRQLDAQPKASQPVNPVYPPEAMRRDQDGSVKLKLKVDEYGTVRDVSVVEGDPPGVFDESALAAFKQAHFIPARKNGMPVRALIYIRVRYELHDRD